MSLPDIRDIEETTSSSPVKSMVKAAFRGTEPAVDTVGMAFEPWDAHETSSTMSGLRADP
jgi:hypothetical protein